MEKHAEKDHESSRSEKGLFDFFSKNRHHGEGEEELQEIVEGLEELDGNERQMVSEILDLSSMAVREIMQPRVDMILVSDEESGRTALERMRGTGYSRLPVYHGDIDGIIGVIYYKDLIGPLMDGRIDEPVTKFMYEPLFVPETKDVFPLLSEMQAKHQQMAIIVDEYGGTHGLVTVEDILEEIVGEIVDETDLDRELITQIDEDHWRVHGSFPVDDAKELGWPLTDSDDYETIAGWLMDTFDSVPKTGDEFIVDGYSFKIERMRRSRIASIFVTRLPLELDPEPGSQTTDKT